MLKLISLSDLKEEKVFATRELQEVGLATAFQNNVCRLRFGGVVIVQAVDTSFPVSTKILPIPNFEPASISSSPSKSSREYCLLI